MRKLLKERVTINTYINILVIQDNITKEFVISNVDLNWHYLDCYLTVGKQYFSKQAAFAIVHII